MKRKLIGLQVRATGLIKLVGKVVEPEAETLGILAPSAPSSSEFSMII